MKVIRKSSLKKQRQQENIVTERNVLLNDHPFLVALILGSMNLDNTFKKYIAKGLD